MKKLGGIVCYKKSQFAAFKNLCTDGDQLPDTYADHLLRVQEAEQFMRGQGAEPVKVYVDIEEWQAWCAANGHRLDHEGRIAFVNHALLSGGGGG